MLPAVFVRKRVRIFASPAIRVQRLAQQWLVTPDEAHRRMEKIDAERRSFRQHHFRQNSDDLRFYDAVFDTDRLSVEKIVHAILGMMTAPEQAQHDEESGGDEILAHATSGSQFPEQCHPAR